MRPESRRRSLSLTAPSIQPTREGVDELVPEVVGSARIGLHPVGEIQVTQLLDTGGESSRHRVGLAGVRTQ